MSVQLTPSKRSYDRGRKDRNGKWKLQKSSNPSSQYKVSPCDTIFRVFCPVSKIGSVIGKGGDIISQLRKESGAKVRVEDPIPGSDERVIFISSSDKNNDVAAAVAKELATEGAKEVAAEDIKEEDAGEIPAKQEGDKEGDTEKGDKASADDDSCPMEVSQTVKDNSAAQKALLLIFKKMVAGETERIGGDEESNKSSNFVVRLLVFTSQVGCILGEGGSVIKKMSSDSGAQILVLPKDEVPPYVSPRDELVQISGDVNVIRSALQAVSQQLLENPPTYQDTVSFNIGGQSSHSFGNHHAKPEAYQEKGIPGPMNPSGDYMTFRVLCHDERIGGVIGRGGTIVRTLQYETGCEIKVVERIPGLEDRIIVISGHVHPDERISAPQDAVLRVQDRIFRAIPEAPGNNVPAKLLINSNQVGCLLGKGGSVMAEMRKATGAFIRILGKDQLPNSAAEDEEVVQINGEFDAVQEALVHITSRLRDHFFRQAFPSNAVFSDQVPPFATYGGQMEHSPPGMHLNVGPPFLGMPPHGGFHPRDDRLPFMHRPGVPPHLSERSPWNPQDYEAVPQRRIGGFGGGIHLPIITNISVKVVVPRSCVDAIYGEDGGCLKQIREFSEAKISIIDPEAGATETLIVISGTPEQTHAAQSLIQAFVMIESDAS